MFAERLKQLRKEKKGLTQEMVAKQIGIAKTTYSAYEQGKRQPDYDTLNRLAKYFNASVDYLLGNTFSRNGSVPNWATDKDRRDLQKFLKNNANSMTYGGEELTHDEKQQLRVAMETIFWKRHKHE
ncbi:MAG: helix-turn-helix transcriptional regulator [Lentilactobacillus hilgardii]|uniref:helix-turn-helix domain-containing protein n=1 Tax=Lactobacillaceae TaxID=33958 RepID=UPI001CC21EAD|nr:helix-turn-helix transcriptional regulator [Lentilactobacillus hilgardii]MBZ2201887.1 transcriptional regulator [Lentilactobacillus hilgardii]MBZ2204563.1 transcriptional regulator [Lentilactobacillus hilgardii]